MKFILQNGQMLPVVDAAIYHAKEHVKEQILTFIMFGVDVLKELSFSIALIGGGICFIVYFLTGVRRAGKLGAVLVVGHALIRFLLG